jgi:hypothetical protein
MDSRLSGGCHCGAIRYRCSLPTHLSVYCHCRSCRRVTGAHAVAWFTVPVKDLQYGPLRPTEYHSSPGIIRTHCSVCGTTLTYWNSKHADSLDVTVASLDAPALAAPGKHIWMDDAVAGDSPNDGLPRFAQDSGTGSA